MVLSNQRQSAPQGAPNGGKLYLKRSDLLLPDEPRLSILWRTKWTIAISAVLAGVCAGLVATIPQTQYSAEATIRVSLLSARGVPREIVLAQNELAAQYTLLATSRPVLAAAEQLAGGPVGTVQATPINGYNIIGITTTAPSAKIAADRADAVAHALVTYVKTADEAAATSANKAVAPQLEQLDAQIKTAQSSVDKLQSQLARSGKEATNSGALQALLTSQLSLLGTLVANRTNVFTSASRDAAAAAPQLTLLNIPEQGEAKPKHELVYGLVALLITALAAAEVSVLTFRLRLLNQTTTGPRPGGQRIPDETPDAVPPQPRRHTPVGEQTVVQHGDWLTRP